MDQQDCLLTPSHFTYLGVCYPGSNASINLSNPNAPQPVHFTVGQINGPTSAPELHTPEPSTIALFVCAALIALAMKRRRAV